MELRDYLTALRRSLALVVLLALAGVSLAAAWLSVAPKEFVATAVVIVAASDPQSIGDAQQGSQMAIVSADTAAAIIDSPAVLDGVASALTPPLPTEQVAEAVTAAARLGSSVIDVSVSLSSPELAADIANRAAGAAVTVVPQLLSGRDASQGGPLLLTLIQPASVPTDPVSPNARGILAIGLVAGLAAGIAVAILRYALDTRVRDVGDIRGRGVPVLAAIPRGPRAQRGTLAVRDRPLSPAGEAFRVLRTNLESVSRGEGRAYVVAPVTSSQDASLVVADLGWSLADAYRRTAIVDLDLRNPRLDALLGVEGGRGVADVLQGKATIDDVTIPTAHRDLVVVPAGATTASPSDLLSSPLLADLVATLAERFDYVLLRAPGVLRYSDAATVARISSGTVLAVHNDHDRRVDVTAAVDALANVGVLPVGLVLTGARGQRLGRPVDRLSGPLASPAQPGPRGEDDPLLDELLDATPRRDRRRTAEETDV